MKDIEYFLYEEDRYNEIERDDFGVYDEDSKEIIFGNDDPLSFLIEKPFHGKYLTITTHPHEKHHTDTPLRYPQYRHRHRPV